MKRTTALGLSVMLSPTNPLTSSMSMQQMTHSSSFALSGNTIGGQYTAITDRSCQSDWLMIPCAVNSGRLPGTQVACIDRFCGGALNTEATVNSTSIISTYTIFLNRPSLVVQKSLAPPFEF
jgi:hypothetical protein